LKKQNQSEVWCRIAKEKRIINKEVKMWNSKLKLRDKYGYPVVFIIGEPITNIIRAIIHTNLKRTFFIRKIIS